jgi:phasin family protein
MQPQTQFFDLYRAGLRTMNDAMKTSLEYSERLQSRQLQLVKKALEETSWSAGQLSQVKGLDDLMAMQMRLAESQFERAVDFWTGVWRSASESQANAISQVTTQQQHRKSA